MLHYKFLVACLALGLTVGCQQDRAGQQSGEENQTAATQDAGRETPGGGTAAQGGGQQFLARAAAVNQGEVELARIAQQRTQNAQVRQLAQQLEQDHSQNLNLVQQTAQQANVGDLQPDQQTLQEGQQVRDRLQELSGKEFDREFIRHVWQKHEQAISEFEQQANQAQNEQIRSYASQTLAAMREHEQQIRQVAQKLGVEVGGAAQGMGAGQGTGTQPERQQPPR